MLKFDDDDSEKIYLMFQKSQMIRSNIHSISQILNTGLSADTLDICMKLVEAGVHPQALAEVIFKIRNESKGLLNDGEET